MSQIFISWHLALNHTYQLQLTMYTCYRAPFYGPTSKLPLHPSGTKSNITSVLFTNLLTLVEKPLYSVTSKIILDLRRLKFEPVSNYITTQNLSVSSVLQIHMLFLSLKFCSYIGGIFALNENALFFTL